MHGRAARSLQVSLFLQEGLQSSDARIRLPSPIASAGTDPVRPEVDPIRLSSDTLWCCALRRCWGERPRCDHRWALCGCSALTAQRRRRRWGSRQRLCTCPASFTSTLLSWVQAPPSPESVPPGSAAAAGAAGDASRTPEPLFPRLQAGICMGRIALRPSRPAASSPAQLPPPARLRPRPQAAAHEAPPPLPRLVQQRRCWLRQAKPAAAR